jgi:photosystem II stability/assembly factor-like uncharacterized protein
MILPRKLLLYALLNVIPVVAAIAQATPPQLPFPAQPGSLHHPAANPAPPHQPPSSVIPEPTDWSVGPMKLLSPTTGWTSSRSNLFWTTDFGAHWKQITPPNPNHAAIASVFFLDENTGWVLFVGGDDQPDDDSGFPFTLASTRDSGQSWTKTTVPIQDKDGTLSGQAHMAFRDALHGWLNLGIVSSSAFDLGGLNNTSDGGITWNSLKSDPGINGEVLPLTEKDGYVAGGPGDTELYATHDGGNTFQELALRAPKELSYLGPDATATYDIPVFASDRKG